MIDQLHSLYGSGASFTRIRAQSVSYAWKLNITMINQLRSLYGSGANLTRIGA